jgi:hypothetical protein
LPKERKTNLRNNCDHVIRVLHSDDELIDALVSAGCFKKEQLKSVTTVTDSCSRNIELLDKLRRSSMRNFELFVQFIRKVQPRVVPLLVGETGKGGYLDFFLRQV